MTDPTPGNNSAADTTTLTPQADVSITKTDGQVTDVPGTTIVYTIVASNAGPSNAPSVTVAVTFPATLTGVTWTCVGAGGGTCTAAGAGNINDAVTLPAGGSVTYTVNATIDANASGTLSNTATATVGGSVTDPVPATNSATDTTTLTPQADLSITKTDGAATEIPGTSVTYTIVASNSGPSNDAAATVADTFPATLTGVTWTCVGAGGGTCTAAGVGNINDTVILPAGGSVTYTASGAISAAATGTLVNTATVTPTCKKAVDGVRLIRDGKVYLRKQCREHGQSEALVSGDADWFLKSLTYIKEGSIPLEHSTQVEKACPDDCGLCPDHEQHSCLPIIEITNHCNLECPICIVQNKHNYDMSLEEMAGMLDGLVRKEGHLETINLSGGEPTMQPRFFEILDLARAKKEISRVSISTNGLRCAIDRWAASAARAARRCGMSPASGRASRSGRSGRAGMDARCRSPQARGILVAALAMLAMHYGYLRENVARSIDR